MSRLPSKADSEMAATLLKIRTYPTSEGSGETEPNFTTKKYFQNASKPHDIPRHPQSRSSSLSKSGTEINSQIIGSSLLNQQFSLPPCSVVSAPPPTNEEKEIAARCLDRHSETTTTVRVRQQEVEKALRSKPQRGRKRSNLNEVERIELTRTRNREHAKTTRIRKKARYQELLENEGTLCKLLKSQALETQRRQHVLQYVSVRERMLQNSISRASTSKSMDLNFATELASILSESTALEYEDGMDVSGGPSAFERMQRFDNTLIDRLATRCSSGKVPLLRYTLPDSEIGICLSHIGVAVARINIVLDNEPRDSLVSAFLTVRFSPQTDKIESIRFDTAATIESCDFGKLQLQMSYPSVVSLDMARSTEQEGQVLL